MSNSAIHQAHHACTCSAGALLAPLVEAPLGQVQYPGSAEPRPWVVPTIADVIVIGRIQTMNSAAPSAEAVAITDGYITAVGSVADIEGLRGPHTEVLDVSGDGVVYPGLIEPHMHYWASALMYDWTNCETRDGTTFDEVVEKISKAKPVQGDWVLGQLFDPSLVEGHKELSRDILDRACPDNPCLVMNASMHYVYVNSKALALAGIDESTPDPVGGVFVKDDQGRLTGALGEMSAMMQVIKIIPQASHEDMVANVIKINHHAASRGYVRTHDAGTGEVIGTAEIGLFHQNSPQFKSRVTYAVLDPAMDKAMEEGLKPFDGDDMCRATHCKFVTDGSNQGYSGYQRENYLNKDFRGKDNYEPDQLTARIARMHEHGWPVMVHANGDAAIDEALDSYEAALAGRSGMRLRDRIEHCSFAHPEQLDRMAQLGISPSFLIAHVYYWGQAFEDDVMGKAKAQLLDPVGSARRRGLRVSTHSDYTVTDLEPFREIQTQVTRERKFGKTPLNPSEAVSVQDALKSKLIDAAWQIHADDVSGTIEVGKLADFVVLNQDPAQVAVETIAETQVLRTIVGGKTVYTA